MGLTSCRSDKRSGGRAAGSATFADDETTELVRTARKAEYRREPKAVPESLLAHRDPEVRQAATRALALSRHASVFETLLAKLADTDGLVVTWAAYGVGLRCRGNEPVAVPALVSRAASWVDSAERSVPSGRFALSPETALADSLGRCNTLEAERTLRAWLDQDEVWAQAAALGLGRLASQRGTLEDTTIVALLEAASRKEPLNDALVPLARVHGLAESTAQRLGEVGSAAVKKGGRARSLALEALPKAGTHGIEALTSVLADGDATPSDRSTAARGLGGSDADGQVALQEALVEVTKGIEPHELRNGVWAPILAALRETSLPIRTALEHWQALAHLGIDDLEPATRRRVIQVRCAAAATLAGSASASQALVECDPNDGRIGSLAVVGVLDRGALIGARRERWLRLARAEDPAVRRAALELLLRHPETFGVSRVLADALRADDPGIVASAARVVVAHFKARSANRDETLPVDPDLVRALNSAIERRWAPDQIEPRGLLFQASASLELLSIKPKAEALCRSSNATLREHARLALRELGQGLAACSEAPPFDGMLPDVRSLPSAPKTLTFVTDAGRLGMTLDPSIAPAAVLRVLELVRKGFYDRMAIHRVVPGFVVQLGDPTGDGYGGAGLPPVPSETAPAPFDAYYVGLAQSGPDTGSSQIFVSLSPDPLLGGDYPPIGWADPEWETVAEGDVIQKVEVKE